MLAREIMQNITQAANSVSKGFYAELLVMQALRASGLSVRQLWHKQTDLLCNGKRIEVKCAIENKTYQFCLRKNDKYGYTDNRNSDFVLLVLVDKIGIFRYMLIPSHELTSKKISVTIHGKYAKYLIQLAKVKHYV